jgi:hemerythrin-like domain-containing protein
MSTTQILPDPPTAMLKAVHGEIKELFAAYNSLRPEERTARKAVVQDLQELLRVHLQIEEALFYPAVQNMQSDLAIKVVMKALQDHRAIKGLLEELKALSLENQSLDLKMGELQECLFAHLQVEEAEIFLHARALPPETLGELGSEMEKLRDRLLGG